MAAIQGHQIFNQLMSQEIEMARTYAPGDVRMKRCIWRSFFEHFFGTKRKTPPTVKTSATKRRRIVDQRDTPRPQDGFRPEKSAPGALKMVQINLESRLHDNRSDAIPS